MTQTYCALWSVKISHMTWNNQSECFISDDSSYSIFKFIYELWIIELFCLSIRSTVGESFNQLMLEILN